MVMNVPWLHRSRRASTIGAVAVSMEVVLVAGEPTTFSPTNVALAINSGCSNCQTLATAYQQVVQNEERVHISGAGRKEITDIHKDLHDLKKSGLDIVAIQQRVDAAAARLAEARRTQVFHLGRPAGAGPADQPTTTAPAPATTFPAPSRTAPVPSTTAPASTTMAAPTTTATMQAP
ncbi:MAG: hypothetical protein ACRD2W_25260 [Acidimicrobiales bacterium]